MPWKEKLSQNGYRVTQPRKAVIEVLDVAKTPLSPAQIHESAVKRDAQLGIVSVYRAIELFAALKLIRRVHMQDGCHGYVLASPGHHHTLICQNCQQTVEFPGNEDLEEFFKWVEEQTGYQINDHLLQLSGMCPRCQQRLI